MTPSRFSTEDLPELPPGIRSRLTLLYHFNRVQAPKIALSMASFLRRVSAMFQRASARKTEPVREWDEFLRRLHALDAFVAAACLEGDEDAWQLLLFDARLGGAEHRLLDALRSRAVRLYPGNEERQNSAVDDFWGSLLVADSPDSIPVLQRYDGLRPLGPWLVTVFQNRHVSLLRGRQHAGQALEEDDLLAEPTPRTGDDSALWHEAFREAAREWLAERATLDDLLLLGLLWRYRLSQREAARLLGVHEGTVSRRIKSLSQNCLSFVVERMQAQGWSGDDPDRLLYAEMAEVLFEEPRLSADALARQLHRLGKSVPQTLDEQATSE
jgi:hypothetical protein